MRNEPPDPITTREKTYKIILLVLYVCLSVLFGGIWFISAAYLGSYSSVWSVPKAGPYIMLNSFLSLLGALLVGFNFQKTKMNGVLFLTLPIILVFLDLLDLLGRFQESQTETLPQILTILFFPPLFFHTYMIYLTAKIFPVRR